MDTSPILIAGGGIAGLAAALGLGAHNVAILEQASAFTTAGAGLQLGPNATRALKSLGAWAAVEPYTSKPKDIQFRDGLSGKLLKRLVLGQAFAKRYGADYHVAHRAGVHAGLLQVVQSRKNLTIQLGQTVQQIELGNNDVHLRLNGKSRRASALIATDGAQSALRQQFFPESAARQAAVTFHRALVPIPNSLNCQPDCVTVWMLPHGHVVHYGIGQPQLLNIVAITPQNLAASTFFANVCSELAQTLDKAIPHFTPWPALYVAPLPIWAIGNAMLLGDAAHGTLPYMAQGAAMALEDAATLQQAISSTHSLRHAFAETATRRMARTKRLHQESIKTGEVYHAHGLKRLMRNLALTNCPDFILHQKLKWLYSR